MNRETTIEPREKQDSTTVVVQSEHESGWQSLSEKQRQIIVSTAIVLGISVVTVVGFMFGRKLIRDLVSKNEQGKSFGKDKYSTWAKQIKNAFDNNGWWGTNEVLLRTVLKEIPSQEDFLKVVKAYRKLFVGKNMIEDMTKELKDTEYNEMLAIVKSKPKRTRDVQEGARIYDPEGWAIRLNAAVNYEWLGFGWGTDTEAIKAVTDEIPTQRAFFDTAKVYEQKYGVKLMDDLQGDLSSSDLTAFKKAILDKPKN